MVVAITPDAEKDRPAFDKLFNYFTERHRYGVIRQAPGLNPAIRDIYLIPLEAGKGTKPDFINLLSANSLEDEVPERMLLLSLVVKLENSPSSLQTPRHPDVASLASPTGMMPANSTPLGGHPGFQNGPPPALPFNGTMYAPPYGGSPLPNQPAFTPPQSIGQQSGFAPPPPQHMQMPVGIDAARYVLGDLANSPSVAILLAEAPGTTLNEFGAIKGFLNNLAARNDYNVLKEMMVRSYHDG